MPTTSMRRHAQQGNYLCSLTRLSPLRSELGLAGQHMTHRDKIVKSFNVRSTITLRSMFKEVERAALVVDGLELMFTLDNIPSGRHLLPAQAGWLLFCSFGAAPFDGFDPDMMAAMMLYSPSHNQFSNTPLLFAWHRQPMLSMSAINHDLTTPRGSVQTSSSLGNTCSAIVIWTMTPFPSIAPALRSLRRVLLKFYGLMSQVSSIIFAPKKQTAAEPKARMATDGHKVAQLSSNLEGDARDRFIDALSSGEAKVLITTKALARGIDVQFKIQARGTHIVQLKPSGRHLLLV
ncbi:hypothetical protein P171DRAFT_497817 [Karstenula rhodostoma CBS 690.94]|uniref:Helicase C-terminal domain-containing protein n=1 Tax=Karstenula rhodostoma CBS 690.94 TaxID=1392251 RepID=A0A9P4PAP4_9PLEO|nr:hypothetical protein P171DRAFT_497817 [Karstenula rhodostoma CBS 690.94]